MSTPLTSSQPAVGVAAAEGGSAAPALAAALLGFFVITLDALVVNVALPAIGRGFGGGMTGLQWVVDSYTLMFAALCLLPGGFAVLGDEVGRDAAALLDVVALLLSPGADSHRIDGAGLAAAASGGAARAAADLAGVGDEVLQGVAKLIIVLGAEVDFVVAAVQGEADGAFGLAAVDVV